MLRSHNFSFVKIIRTYTYVRVLGENNFNKYKVISSIYFPSASKENCKMIFTSRENNLDCSSISLLFDLYLYCESAKSSEWSRLYPVYPDTPISQHAKGGRRQVALGQKPILPLSRGAPLLKAFLFLFICTAKSAEMRQSSDGKHARAGLREETG